MEEKILKGNKNGMSMMLLLFFLYALGIGAIVAGAVMVENKATPFSVALLVLGIIWVSLGWIPFLGLKVLKPQEALVLTLFEGFYYVNPFCTGVNPAARTRLNQSGDVDNGSGKMLEITTNAGGNKEEIVGKKISMKIMTLNNSRQKINDCLGNPIEIGIAVMWRVVDTAKAVFEVDN